MDLESPSTLIGDNFDSQVLDMVDITRNEGSFLENQVFNLNDQEISNQREGLSASLARKWSQLRDEYITKSSIDKSVPEVINSDFEGWIYIKSDDIRGWKKRYGVLNDGSLYIFKNNLVNYSFIKAKKQTFTHSIAITSGYTVSPSSGFSKTQYSFQLVHTEWKTIHFAATSQASMLTWINAIVRAGLGIYS